MHRKYGLTVETAKEFCARVDREQLAEARTLLFATRDFIANEQIFTGQWRILTQIDAFLEASAP